MRIGIDARFFGSLGKGLGRYTSELIRELEEVDKDNEYVIFLRKENWDEYSPKNPKFRKVLAEFPWYSWKEQLVYPFWLRGQKLDLMHFPHFNVPLLYRKPFVVTIHDLILLHFPTPRATTLGPLHFRIKYLAYKFVIKSALKRAKAILTVSKFTQGEILTTFPFTKDKPVVVTYNACGNGIGGPSKESAGGRNAALPSVRQPYMMYVGNAYPHKNLERLIRAFAEFRRMHRKDFRLVLVGMMDYFYSRLKDEAAKRSLDENILFFGHATDTELASLYDNAEFYIFPSEYEGFGIPPLEAMCRGIPVASSGASCLPEILGDSALYFDPTDIKDMVKAMRRMTEDSQLRDRLKEKGREQSGRYDWRTSAELAHKAYMEALGITNDK